MWTLTHAAQPLLVCLFFFVAACVLPVTGQLQNVVSAPTMGFGDLTTTITVGPVIYRDYTLVADATSVYAFNTTTLASAGAVVWQRAYTYSVPSVTQMLPLEAIGVQAGSQGGVLIIAGSKMLLLNAASSAPGSGLQLAVSFTEPSGFIFDLYSGGPTMLGPYTQAPAFVYNATTGTHVAIIGTSNPSSFAATSRLYAFSLPTLTVMWSTSLPYARCNYRVVAAKAASVNYNPLYANAYIANTSLAFVFAFGYGPSSSYVYVIKVFSATGVPVSQFSSGSYASQLAATLDGDQLVVGFSDGYVVGYNAITLVTLVSQRAGGTTSCSYSLHPPVAIGSNWYTVCDSVVGRWSRNGASSLAYAS
jgi:hypothetical protein